MTSGSHSSTASRQPIERNGRPGPTPTKRSGTAITRVPPRAQPSASCKQQITTRPSSSQPDLTKLAGWGTHLTPRARTRPREGGGRSNEHCHDTWDRPSSCRHTFDRRRTSAGGWLFRSRNLAEEESGSMLVGKANHAQADWRKMAHYAGSPPMTAFWWFTLSERSADLAGKPGISCARCDETRKNKTS
jgi:hypothetical protein